LTSLSSLCACYAFIACAAFSFSSITLKSISARTCSSTLVCLERNSAPSFPSSIRSVSRSATAPTCWFRLCPSSRSLSVTCAAFCHGAWAVAFITPDLSAACPSPPPHPNACPGSNPAPLAAHAPLCTCIPVHIHPCAHLPLYTYIPVHIRPCAYASLCTSPPVDMHPSLCTFTPVHMHPCAHASLPTCPQLEPRSSGRTCHPVTCHMHPWARRPQLTPNHSI